jgi:excisionase family DNA binding protein
VSTSISNSFVNFEPFVDAEHAARFLAISRKTLLSMARNGRLPAHGLPGKGKRKIWKFRLSELDYWMRTEVTSVSDQCRTQERKNFL